MTTKVFDPHLIAHIVGSEQPFERAAVTISQMYQLAREHVAGMTSGKQADELARCARVLDDINPKILTGKPAAKAARKAMVKQLTDEQRVAIVNALIYRDVLLSQETAQ